MYKHSCTNAYASSSRVTVQLAGSGLQRRSVAVELTSPTPSPAVVQSGRASSPSSSQDMPTSTLPGERPTPRTMPPRQRRLAIRQPLSRTTASSSPSKDSLATVPLDTPHPTNPITQTAPHSSPTAQPRPSQTVLRLFARTTTAPAANPSADPAQRPSPSASSREKLDLRPRTTAELDQLFNFTDDQVRTLSLQYAKKVLRGDPSFAVIKSRLLKVRYAAIVGKAKNPSKSEVQELNAGADWKQYMGLRGVPVISKYPTDAHPTTATGIWGVKQTGEVAAGDRVPPTSSWVGPTAVRSDICQTTRRSNLYIQFIRRFPSKSKSRTVAGPTLLPSSRQLPHLPPSFLPELVPRPIFVIHAWPPDPRSSTLLARRAAFLARRDPNPRWGSISYEVSPAYVSEVNRLAAEPSVTDETRAQVALYMTRKLQKAGFVGYPEGTTAEAVGKLWTRRGKTERVVVECDSRVSKKTTHVIGTRRKKAASKLREAVRMVLLTEYDKGDQSTLDWRGWTYELRPTGQVTQVPMDVLTEYVRRALLQLCSKAKYSVVTRSQQPVLGQTAPSFLSAPTLNQTMAQQSDRPRPSRPPPQSSQPLPTSRQRPPARRPYPSQGEVWGISTPRPKDGGR